MSGMASETTGAATAEESAPPALTESETGETEMTYGHGTFPWIVKLVWLVALAGFAWYMLRYALPDLTLWRQL